MPKLAGRGVYLAALAVPIAMVAAPLTASAVDTHEAPLTETVAAKGDASWFQGSVWDWVWIHENEQSIGGNINGIYHHSPVTNTNVNTVEVSGNDGVDVDAKTEPAPAEVPAEEAPPPAEPTFEQAPVEEAPLEEAPAEEPMPEPAPEQELASVEAEPAVESGSLTFAYHHEEWAYSGYDGAEAGQIDSVSGTGDFPAIEPLPAGGASGSFAYYHSELATAGPDAAYSESVDSISGTGTIGGEGEDGSFSLSGSGSYHHEEFAYAGYDGAAAGSATSASGTGSIGSI